jgi:hypothetical protein
VTEQAAADQGVKQTFSGRGQFSLHAVNSFTCGNTLST